MRSSGGADPAGDRWGEFRDVDAEATAVTIIALYEGLALLWAVDPEAVHWDGQGASAIRMLLEGLRRQN